MGLDVQIACDAHHEVYHSLDYKSELMSLSREFCHLLLRKDEVEHTSELEQIYQITSVDITPISEMLENYAEEEDIIEIKNYIDNTNKGHKVLDEALRIKEKIDGNIKRVLVTVQSLISNLSVTEKLPGLLLDTEYDTLRNAYYFSKFNLNLGDGYIDNNFGQDLRNFEKFLIFAISKGAKTVWFHVE